MWQDQLFFPGGAVELNSCCSLQTCVYFPLIQPLGNNSVFLGILLLSRADLGKQALRGSGKEHCPGALAMTQEN